MNDLARRDFLKYSGTAILGFPFVVAGAEAAEPALRPSAPRADLLDGLHGKATPLQSATPDELLTAARERMKQECKPGVVILVPAEPNAASKLAADLATLLGGKKPAGAVGDLVPADQPPAAEAGNPEAHQLFCQAVFVCVNAESVRKLFPQCQADTAALLLDPVGKPLAEAKASETLFSSGFVGQLTELLHGKQGERLATTIRAQRTALGKEAAERVDAALRALDAEQFFTRQQAAVVLGGLAPRATAQLAAELRKKPSLEKRRRVEYFFDEIYAAASEDKPSVRLPFGTQWQLVPAHACFACGRSAVPLPARLFLRFLVQDKK